MIHDSYWKQMNRQLTLVASGVSFECVCSHCEAALAINKQPLKKWLANHTNNNKCNFTGVPFKMLLYFTDHSFLSPTAAATVSKLKLKLESVANDLVSHRYKLNWKAAAPGPLWRRCRRTGRSHRCRCFRHHPRRDLQWPSRRQREPRLDEEADHCWPTEWGWESGHQREKKRKN